MKFASSFSGLDTLDMGKGFEETMTMGALGFETISDFGKTVKVMDPNQLKNLMSASDDLFFEQHGKSQTISDLKNRINLKKKENTVDTPSETQVDSFNMKLLQNKGGGGMSPTRSSMLEPLKPDNIRVNKLKHKMKVLPRDRSQKNILKTEFDAINMH